VKPYVLGIGSILILPLFLVGCLLQEIMVAPYQGQATRSALATSLKLEILLEPRTLFLSSNTEGTAVLRLSSTSAQRYHPKAAYLGILQGAAGVDCHLLSPQPLWVKPPTNQIWEWHFDEQEMASKMLSSGFIEVRVQCRFTAPGIYEMEGGIYLAETHPAPFAQHFRWEVRP